MNAYDFDKTIYKNDSSTEFIIFLFKRYPKAFLSLPKITIAYVKFFIFKKGIKEDFKEKAFSVLKFADINRDVADFWDKNRHKIKKFYLEQKQKDDVIISASPRFLLTPIMKELGIKHLICSEVNCKTGKFNAPNCYGEEKVNRFRKALGNRKIEEFYSDSYSDTPMAEISEKAFLVKGDSILPWK